MAGELGELASDNNMIYPNRATITYGYDGSGNLTSETLTQYGNVYVKTYTWTGSNLTGQSLWIKQ